MRKVFLMGLGAVGASVAAQFLDENYPISILCDEERKKRYLEEGIIINGKNYNFDYVIADEITYQPDLILIVVKYYNLAEAIEQLEGLVGEKTIVMSLLNGIDSEDIIAERFGFANLLYSFIYKIDANRAHNRVEHYSKGIMVFGEKNGQLTEKTALAREIFEQAKINYELSDNILRRMWWKYLTNIGLNQTTAILRIPYSVIQREQYAQELAKEAMREVVQISQAININLSEADINSVLEMLQQLDPNSKTSMLQDVESKRKTEVDMLSGKLCQMGEQYQIPTPINRVFYHLIKSIENSY